MKYARAVKGVKKLDIAGEYDAVINTLNKVMSNLQKGIFVLTQKKEARYLLLLAAQSLRSVVEKAQNNFEK